METVEIVKAPEPVIWKTLSNKAIRKVLTAITLLMLIFFPTITLTDNGQIVESIYYFPWAIFRIFNPVAAYNTSQLQMAPLPVLILFMLPTYYAIFSAFQFLKEDANLLSLSIKIAGAELIQLIIIAFSLMSGAPSEARTIFAWRQIILVVTYALVAVALFVEKARLDLYRQSRKS